MTSTATGRTRNWDDERRFGEQEADGVVAEVIFPNTVPPFFPTGARDRAAADARRVRAAPGRDPGAQPLARRLLHGAHPERRAGVGQIFLNDVDDAIADVHFIEEHGLRGGVLLPAVPPTTTDILPLYDPAFDPLWAACEELERRRSPPLRPGRRPTTGSTRVATIAVDLRDACSSRTGRCTT